jgi:hypothetical protein
LQLFWKDELSTFALVESNRYTCKVPCLKPLHLKHTHTHTHTHTHVSKITAIYFIIILCTNSHFKSASQVVCELHDARRPGPWCGFIQHKVNTFNKVLNLIKLMTACISLTVRRFLGSTFSCSSCLFEIY